MAKNDDKFTTEGTVVDCAKGGLFKVKVEMGNGQEHYVMATLSGKLMMNKIRVLVGDTVDVEISSIDLSRGRIVWRSK